MADSDATEELSLERLVAKLTDHERRALLKGIETVQDELTRRVIRELRRYVFMGAGTVVAILTTYGIVSWSGMRDDIVKSASSRIAGDSQLKSELIQDATSKLDTVDKLERKAFELEKELDSNAAMLTSSILEQMRELSSMLQQIKTEANNAKDLPKP